MKKIFAACLIGCFITPAAKADIIYFKDGLKTICQDRAWEENDQVKCEFSGWVITYQKSDVLQILKSTPPKKPNEIQKEAPTSRNKAALQGASNKSNHPKKGGTAFYDPRREKKYWLDQNSGYDSYDDAIQALAKKYNRTPEWIRAHIGDSNDLEKIHRNLSESFSAAQMPDVSSEPDQTSGIIFYNPRRTFPYWTGLSEKFKSYKDAIQALARKYGRPAQWIQENMGKTNDLAEIHRNLQARKAAESSE